MLRAARAMWVSGCRTPLGAAAALLWTRPTSSGPAKVDEGVAVVKHSGAARWAAGRGDERLERCLGPERKAMGFVE